MTPETFKPGPFSRPPTIGDVVDVWVENSDELTRGPDGQPSGKVRIGVVIDVNREALEGVLCRVVWCTKTPPGTGTKKTPYIEVRKGDSAYDALCLTISPSYFYKGNDWWWFEAAMRPRRGATSVMRLANKLRANAGL